MPSKKKPTEAAKPLDVEVVDVDVPTGDSERHLYEVKMLLSLPAGTNLDVIQSAAATWVLKGSGGVAQLVPEYGGSIKNVTLCSPAGRAAFSKGTANPGATRGNVMCVDIQGKSLPKSVKTLKVIRIKKK